MRVIPAIFVLSLCAGCDGCDGRGGAPENALVWEPVPAGVVLTRNLMVPPSPEDAGYRILPGRYRLGTGAYARPPPGWWLEIVRRAGVSDRWHPGDFPLAYAGEFKQDGGRTVLLVVQCSHAFTGDGYSGPGPAIYLVARLLAHDNGGMKLVAEHAYDLGSMQYSRLSAGDASGRRVVFRIEQGEGFNSDRAVSAENWTLTVNGDDSLNVERGKKVDVSG